MKRAASLILSLVLVASCRSSGDTSSAQSQEKFGVQMARMNLWREALFRFQRAATIDPGSAAAQNNLAVAYEANGDFENAAKAYREAMRLDRTNQYIQKNYSRLVEFQSRNKKRQQQQRREASPTTTATPPGGLAMPPVTPIDPAAAPAPPPAQPPSTSPPTPAPTAAQPAATPPSQPAPPPPNPPGGHS